MEKRVKLYLAILILISLLVLTILSPKLVDNTYTSELSIDFYKNFKPKKQVFAGHGENCSIGFGISSGYYPPGSNVTASLFIYRWEYYEYNLSFIGKLYRIRDDGGLILLKEYVFHGFIGKMEVKLPDDEGVKYLLAVEAYLGDELVDLIYSIIIAPKQYVNARLYLDKTIYRVGEVLKYTIVDMGGDPILFGLDYEIYYWNGYKWILDKELTPQFIPDLAIILSKGESRTLEASLKNAKMGIYKIVVEVMGETTNIRKKLEAIFIVI